jgi:hypothetical protein
MTRRITDVIKGFVIPLLTIGASFTAVGIMATPAHAQTEGVCGDYGDGYCLNDWNGGGSGNAVKMYYGNSSNEDFSVWYVPRCSGSNHVTIPSDGSGDTYCPFGNQPLDEYYNGEPIFAIQYDDDGTDYCVGTNSSGDAILTSCPNFVTGAGGGNGTILIEDNYGSCEMTSFPGYLVDKYWADYYDETGIGLNSNGFEDPLQMNSSATDCFIGTFGGG